MRESIKYSYSFNWNFPPAFWDYHTALRGHEDRPIPQRHPFFSSQRSLYGQEAYFELHPCNPSCQIGRDTQTYMSHDILYPSHSDLLESMTLLEDTVKSFNDGSLFVETGEGFAATERSHPVLDLIIFLKIEDGSVSSSPANGAKETLLSFLFEEAAAELESLSFGFSSPVGQFESSFTDILPICSKGDVSSVDGIFPSPWIFCNDRGNLILDQVACIFRGVVPCISDEGLDLFIYSPEVFLRFFGQLFEKLSIPFMSWRDLDSQRDRQFGIGDLEMDLVTEEAKVFAFSAPGSLRIRFFGFDMRGVDGESEVFFFDKAEGLGNEVDDCLGEGFLSESLSEVMKGVVVGSISVGESTEVGESSVVTEFSGEVSFRGGVAQVDQKEGFEEANRVIAFSPLIGGFIFGELVDEGEVDVLVEDFQGVIRWDDGGDFSIDKTELFLPFHFGLLGLMVWVHGRSICGKNQLESC